MSAWAEAKTADGRVYYYHKQTKETKWEKPAEFDAAPKHDPAAVDGSWNETTAPDGRKYYYNSITRETVWNAPEAFLRNPKNAAPKVAAGGGPPSGGFGDGPDGYQDRRLARRDDRGRDHGLPQKPGFDRAGGGGGGPWENRQDNAGFRGAMPVKTDEPEYSSLEQAEEAFFKVLKKHNVTPDTEWTDALRLIIRERDFRAFKDPKERQQAFDKYRRKVREQEKIMEKERREKRRQDYRTMLTMHPEIKYFSRWVTIKPRIEREAAYKSVDSDDECKAMCREYVSELYRRHLDEEAEQYTSITQDLEALLSALVIAPDLKWVEAHEMVTKNERLAARDTFHVLDDLDILTAFEKKMKEFDQAANESKQKEKRKRHRQQRKARDQFKQLLNELHTQGKIRAGTSWKSVHPLIAEDQRYIDLLGNPGSTPLDLFWDVVEDEEKKLRAKRNIALDVLEDQRFEMVVDTSKEEFASLMRSDPRTSSFVPEDVNLIYQRLMEKVRRRAEDRSEKSERHIKRAIDGLRSAIKHLEPPVRLGDLYDSVEPRIRDTDEYRALEDNDRRKAFDKHMDRLKEKEEEEYERDRSRRDHRNASRRDDRDRRHRTRTPEVDAYEADRRKAQADRERHYRKASFGLSPPPPSRDRRDDRDRESRRRDYDSVYERERRERELERERNYISRADPRDKGRSLDYGDDEAGGSGASRPGSAIRKRRESETSEVSRRDNKRARRDYTRTPDADAAAAASKAEETALQSGSEEGEIEEV